MLVVNVVDHKLDPLDSLEAIVDLESLYKDRVQVVLDTLCERVGLLGPLARVWVLEEHEHLWVTERDGILVLEFFAANLELHSGGGNGWQWCGVHGMW